MSRGFCVQSGRLSRWFPSWCTKPPVHQSGQEIVVTCEQLRPIDCGTVIRPPLSGVAWRLVCGRSARGASVRNRISVSSHEAQHPQGQKCVMHSSSKSTLKREANTYLRCMAKTAPAPVAVPVSGSRGIGRNKSRISDRCFETAPCGAKTPEASTLPSG